MAKMIEIKLDGQTVRVPEGLNLVDAARSVGVDIPNLCHLEHMRGVGACRMCVVEVEGRRGTLTACTTRAKDGMEVTTESDDLRNVRRTVIDLLLSMHPLDCMTCPKAGVCWLQDLAYRLDVRESSYNRKSFNHPQDDSNGFIERDPNYCILCGKCVRVCTAQNTNILEFMGRGVGGRVATAQDQPLQDTGCTFCGSCIDACPVNAILESGRRLRGREWQLMKTDTVCTLCGGACDVSVGEKDGEIVKVSAPKPNAYICAAGRFGHDALQADSRVRTPLVRKDGTLVAATWDEALDLVAARLEKARTTPGSIGIVGSAALINEDAYMLQKFGRAVLGTPNVDSTASLYDTATAAAFGKAFGQVPETGRDIADADLIVAMGVNPSQWSRNLPALDAAIRKRVSAGGKLIVLDPAETSLASVATKHLKIEDGTDTAALQALMAELVQKKLLEKGREAKARGLNDLKKNLQNASVAELAGQAGLAGEDLGEAAELLAKSAAPLMLYGTGVSSRDNGADVVLQALNLAALTDGRVMPAALEANLVGVTTMGLATSVLPGLAADGTKLAKAWKTELPAGPGRATGDMLSGGLDVLIAAGEVPAAGRPADFVVAQVSHLTALAGEADVVLPMPAFVEQEGTMTDTAGVRRMLWSALEPDADVMTPWQTAVELAERLGAKMKVEMLDDVMDEIEKVVKPSKAVWQAVPVTPARGSGRAQIGTDGSLLRLSGTFLRSSRVAALLEQPVSA